MALACLRVLVCFCVLLAAGCSTLSPEERVSAFDEAVRLYDAGEYEAAYKAFDALSYVDAAAARNTALMLRKGEGVEKDPAAAKQMFAFAARAGMATAAADLGEMLLLGEGEPPNPAAALPWLQLAASAHHAIAEYNLGTMYEEANGVPRDVERARALYAESAQAGYELAKTRLAALGGEPPPLRGSTEEEARPDQVNPLEGPSRISGPDSAPLPASSPLNTPPPAAASPAPPTADDYEDISKPDFSPPEDALPQPVLPQPGLPFFGGDGDSLPALPPSAP